MPKYTEELSKIHNELKHIKRDIKISSFNTIYTSIIILGASIIISYIIINKFNFWIGFLGAGLFLAIILQFLSIFNETLKKASIWILWGVILYSILIFSYILFPSEHMTTFSIKTIFGLRNILNAIVFIFLYFVVIIPISKYFEK